MLEKIKNKFNDLNTEKKRILFEGISYVSIFGVVMSLAAWYSLSSLLSLLSMGVFFISDVISTIKASDYKELIIEERANSYFEEYKDNHSLINEHNRLDDLIKKQKKDNKFYIFLIILIIIVFSGLNVINFGLGSILCHLFGLVGVLKCVKDMDNIDIKTEVQRSIIDKFANYEEEKSNNKVIGNEVILDEDKSIKKTNSYNYVYDKDREEIIEEQGKINEKTSKYRSLKKDNNNNN